MQLTARDLELEDMKEASELVWKSFYYHNSRTCTMAAIESFRESVSVAALQLGMLGGMRFVGAFSDGLLVGVGALKPEGELSLLFVRHDRIRQGVGAFLLSELKKGCAAGRITVNSSDFAVDFYKKNGFAAAGGRSVRGGIYYTPMVLDLA